MPGRISPGDQVGRFRVEAEVGRGGMGVVYRAVDPGLNRPVALKVLGHHLLQEDSARQRFQREAAALANLKHPNIALVYEFGEYDEQPYMALEWVEGRTLMELLRETGPLPPERAFRLATQLATALDDAHQRGIVHRDLKPSNILIGPNDHATLVDFGLAWIAAAPALTQTTAFFGTPRYTAPEHIRGEAVDGRADQYSLAIVVYEMLTGQIPFNADTTASLLHHHLYTAPLPVTELRPTLPPEIEGALARALSKQPELRFHTAGDFIAALRGQLVSETIAPILIAQAEPDLGSTAAHPPVTRSGSKPPQPTPAAGTPPGGPLARLGPWAWPVGGVAIGALAVAGLAGLLSLGAWLNGATQPTPTTTSALEAQLAGMQTQVAALATSTATPEPTEEPTPVEEPFATATLIPTPVPNPPQGTGWWPMRQGGPHRNGFVEGGLPDVALEPQWEKYPGFGIVTDLTIADTLLFVGLESGEVAGIDWETGVRRWISAGPVGEALISEPVVYFGDDGQVVIIAYANGEGDEQTRGIVGLNAYSGEELWRHDSDSFTGRLQYDGLTIVWTGVLYAVTEDGILYGLNPVDGSLFGELDLSEETDFWQPLAATDWRVAIAGSNQQLYGLDPSTGELSWKADLAGGPVTSPIIWSDAEAAAVYIGTDSGRVQGFWLWDGNPIGWSTTPRIGADDLFRGLATDGARLYATTQAGQIYAWDAATGEYLWAHNTGVELVQAPLTDGETVAVHTTAGEILFFNAADGAQDVDRTLTPGGGWAAAGIGGGWWFVPSWTLYAYGPGSAP